MYSARDMNFVIRIVRAPLDFCNRPYGRTCAFNSLAVISLSARWQPCRGGIDSQGSRRKTALTECGLATTTMEVYIDERLCEEVRKYPPLYNYSMKEYKDIYMGFNSWHEIEQTLALLGQERYAHASNVCSNEVYNQ